jgi:hypothetical protein
MSSANWINAFPVFVAGALTILGWWAVNWLGEKRDRRNKIRELRMQYLTNACRLIAQVGRQGDVLPLARELEEAVSDVYLFGTSRQIELVRKFVVEFSTRQSANMDELINTLRNDLRRDLLLPPLAGNAAFLKVTPLKKPQ